MMVNIKKDFQTSLFLNQEISLKVDIIVSTAKDKTPNFFLVGPCYKQVQICPSILVLVGVMIMVRLGKNVP